MVQEEDRQNKELLNLSQQILQLTKQVRSDADAVAAARSESKELLDLMRQTLAMTKDLHARPNSGTAAGS
jgi:hypothetical protein